MIISLHNPHSIPLGFKMRDIETDRIKKRKREKERLPKSSCVSRLHARVLIRSSPGIKSKYWFPCRCGCVTNSFLPYFSFPFPSPFLMVLPVFSSSSPFLLFLFSSLPSFYPFVFCSMFFFSFSSSLSTSSSTSSSPTTHQNPSRRGGNLCKK